MVEFVGHAFIFNHKYSQKSYKDTSSIFESVLAKQKVTDFLLGFFAVFRGADNNRFISINRGGN